MSFWCLQFPPKNERKQVNLRFHSSKVEFVGSFHGGNVSLKKSFRLFLTFNFDTDTQLRGQCQETAHSNAIRHLEDLWDIENLQGVWESGYSKRGN